MLQKKHFTIAPINLTRSEEKLLNQIWRDEYPDCATLEEMLRRFLLQKVRREVKIRSAFNIYKKMRRNSEPEEIFARLRKDDLPEDVIRAKMAKDKEEKEAEQNENASDEN